MKKLKPISKFENNLFVKMKYLKHKQKILVQVVAKKEKSFNGLCDCIGSPLELALTVNLFLAIYQYNHFNFARRLKPKEFSIQR